ncbi:MAG: sugar ABC transporter substrate-binding protein [Limnochordaceae bacterium]|nr:sugar ABC transporter substrate-binding protein [Limnochordaceae bacterium]
MARGLNSRAIRLGQQAPVQQVAEAWPNVVKHIRRLTLTFTLAVAMSLVTGGWLLSVGLTGIPTAQAAQSSQSIEPVTIRVAMASNPGEREIHEEIARAFERTHPNIKVQPLLISNRVTEQLVRVAAGDPPDVIYLNPSYFGSFMHQGILLDLAPYVRKDNVPLGDIFPTLIQQLQSNGKLYAIPFELTSIATLYNQTQFEQAGLPSPPTQWNDDSWTWDTFVQYGRRLTRDSNGDGKTDQWGVGLVLGAIDQITYPFVFQNGGQIFDDRTDRFLLNSEPSVQALQWLADLINKEKIALGPIWGGDAYFAQEKIAMLPFGRWLKQFGGVKFQWNAVPLPKQRRAATMLVWLAFGIAANSRHKDEAWEYLKFLITPEVQAMNTARGEALSVLSQLGEMPIFQNAAPRGHYGVFAQGVAYAQPVPYADDDAKVSGAIWSALEPVFTGRRTAKQAMDSIATQVENLLRASHKGMVSPTQKR